MKSNLRLYLLLGVLFVLLVTASVVFYPTLKNRFKKEEGKATVTTTPGLERIESNKVELVEPTTGNSAPPKTVAPVPEGVIPPGPLPTD